MIISYSSLFGIGVSRVRMMTCIRPSDCVWIVPGTMEDIK